MKPKTFLLLAVAIVCGLAASYLTSRLLADRHDEVEKVRILVAKRQLNMGEPIKAPQDMFEEREYLKDQEPRDALAKFDDIKGRILKKGLRTGDFIRVEDLIDSRDQGVAGALPEGFRAMSQRVSNDGGGVGFILPYSRVDVIQTVRRDDANSYAKIVLDNVLVIANGTTTTVPEGGQAMPTAIVTFALSPEDALKLHLAREVGSISLILRKVNDNGPSPVSVVRMQQLNAAPTTRPAEIENPEPATPQTIDILRLDPANAKVAAKAEPAFDPLNMTIIEGKDIREVSFPRDSRGRFVRDVARTELAPRPTPVQE